METPPRAARKQFWSVGESNGNAWFGLNLTFEAGPRNVPLVVPEIVFAFTGRGEAFPVVVELPAASAMSSLVSPQAFARTSVAAASGTLTDVEGKSDPRYNRLTIHDLRRSAIKNLMKAGVSERVAMSISVDKTRDVFDRYHIVDREDVVEAMRRVQRIAPTTNLVSNGEKTVKTVQKPSRKSY